MTPWKNSQLVMLWMWVLSTASLPCMAAELSPGDLETARFVIAGHQDSRERLRSGRFRATGRRLHNSRFHKLKSDVEVRIHCAFDLDRGLLRFDRVEPQLNPKIQKRPFGGKLAVWEDRIVVYDPPSIAVHILAPGSVLPVGLSPFDVRTLGSLNLAELETNMQFEKIFDDETGFLTDRVLSEVVEESENVYRLTWILADGWGRRQIWFDASMGYSPVRMEDQARWEAPTPKSPWSEPTSRSELTWTRISDVWVPREFKIESRGGVATPPFTVNRLRSYSYAFEWESVNQPVPEKLFTAKGFDDEAANELLIVENRFGNAPIVLKMPKSTAAAQPPLQPQPRRFFNLYLLITVNLAALLVVMGVAFYRRRRRLQ